MEGGKIATLFKPFSQQKVPADRAAKQRSFSMQYILPPHGGDVEFFRRRYPGRDWLDFSASINPLGMPAAVRRALEDCGEDSQRYPDPHSGALREAIAAAEGVTAEQVFCGNGASDLIWRAVYALRPKQAMVCAPTFAEYRRALEAAGCAVRQHLLTPEDGFALDESILPLVERMDMVFLCNPNNPTGKLIDPPLLEKLCRAAHRAGTVLVVDECFLDFVPGGNTYSAKKYLRDCEKLIILKAYTKIFAIPGVRLGHCLSHCPALLKAVDGAGPPWSVGVPAQRCGVLCAAQGEFVRVSQDSVRRWRKQLCEGMAALGLTVFPGAANYLLLRAKDPQLMEKLCEYGILIRDCRNFAGLGSGYFRVAVRTGEENAALLGALEQILL